MVNQVRTEESRSINNLIHISKEVKYPCLASTHLHVMLPSLVFCIACLRLVEFLRLIYVMLSRSGPEKRLHGEIQI